MPTTIRRVHAPGAVLCGVLLLAACGTSAPPPASSSPPTNVPPLATDPGGIGGEEPGGTGGGAPGDPGSGGAIGVPIGPAPGDPGAGQPTIVVPKPGRLDPHPVAPIALASSVDGRHVLVKVSWYGGVAPCSVLDSVKVARSGNAIELTVIEGADALDTVCPEIAMLKATIVDLGDLQSGTWSIRATNSDVAPIDVTII